ARQRAVDAEQQQARLRFEAEVRQQITQAALLISQERFAEADTVLSEIALTQPTIEGAAVFRAAGEWHALNNRWREAADRFAMLVDVNHLDNLDTATMDYLECGPALIGRGDLAAYDRFRDHAIRRFAGSASAFTDRIIKISLLMPASPRTLEALRPLADVTTKALAAADAGGDAFTAAWRSISLGLFEYRRGNYRGARDWALRCLAYPDNNPPRAATAHLLLALATQQLGDSAAAAESLQEARALVESRFKGTLEKGTPMQGFWFDWAFARVLLREAITLIQPGVDPTAS
ncbi:MAG TPA: serine/threonine protein kinase, partial [Candidatus Synoicihabitans sp.]|nr:serine/threonine protein kinase [Candidatus Synoicihabitans sp.]